MDNNKIMGELARQRRWVAPVFAALFAGSAGVTYLLLGMEAAVGAMIIMCIVFAFFLIGEKAYVAFSADNDCVMFTEAKGKTYTILYRDISSLKTYTQIRSVNKDGSHKYLIVFLQFKAGGKKYLFLTKSIVETAEVKHDPLRKNRLVNETDAKKLYDHIKERKKL